MQNLHVSPCWMWANQGGKLIFIKWVSISHKNENYYIYSRLLLQGYNPFIYAADSLLRQDGSKNFGLKDYQQLRTLNFHYPHEC